MKTIRRILIAAAAALAVLSCATPRQITYLQDFPTGESLTAPLPPELKAMPGDKLNIEVFSENEQLSAPFNETIAGASEGHRVHSYTVSQDGTIEFPVLGTLNVGGLPISQVRQLIADKISKSGFIREPIVNVTLDSFKITVLGNVNNTVLTVKEPSIDIFEVVARSGGAQRNVKIKEVMVVRTEDGVKTSYAVNLKSKDIYQSPVYYLQQNDVVYFKPRGSSLSSEGNVVMTFVGTGLTLTSIITNLLIWTRYR